MALCPIVFCNYPGRRLAPWPNDKSQMCPVTWKRHPTAEYRWLDTGAASPAGRKYECVALRDFAYCLFKNDYTVWRDNCKGI